MRNEIGSAAVAKVAEMPSLECLLVVMRSEIASGFTRKRGEVLDYWKKSTIACFFRGDFSNREMEERDVRLSRRKGTGKLAACKGSGTRLRPRPRPCAAAGIRFPHCTGLCKKRFDLVAR